MTTTDSYRQHLDAMTVRQARINEGDMKWYLVTANGYRASTGFTNREDAEYELAERRRAAEDDAA